MATEIEPSKSSATDAAPIILDFGSQKAKTVSRLCDGKGKLLVEILESIKELQANGVVGSNVQPIIAVVRERVEPSSLMFTLSDLRDLLQSDDDDEDDDD